tara:strand:- start:399 stop:983 length:585 start_codon:yes stop_codon:yes gene_type:complete
MIDNITSQKRELRKILHTKRIEIYKKSKNVFSKKIFNELFNNLPSYKIKIISSFISIKSEISTSKLNQIILEEKKTLCLPVIDKPNNPLIFREFKKNTKLVKGFMNILEPAQNEKKLIPDILFVPCLAFDDKGYRLGYGGGYYDKTFEYFNKTNKQYISVGYAFDEQKIFNLPVDSHDIKLDFIMTEKSLYTFL